MVWIAVFLAWSIWAHFGGAGIRVVGMSGAIIVLAIALRDFLDMYWKVKPREAATGPERDLWGHPVRRLSSLSRGFSPSRHSAANIPETSWLARATTRPPRRYDSLTPSEPA